MPGMDLPLKPVSPETEVDKPEPVERTELVKTTKAYKNADFLSSPEARMIRVQCELMEPLHRLEQEGVRDIIMFFGSARAKSREEYDKDLAEMVVKAEADPTQGPKLERMRKQEFLIRYYEETTKLAGQVASWSKRRQALGQRAYHVATGGGPGMMCAANKGAAMENAPTVGFGISVPFEDGLNPYVSPELAFEFHYFFTRKFWMAYKMMGLIIAPGGFGTLDELFELLTLMQTGKIKRKVPIILLGKQYWEAVINWQAMVDHGMIAQDDADGVFIVDTADEAMAILEGKIVDLEHREQDSPTTRSRNRYGSVMDPGAPGAPTSPMGYRAD